MANPEARASSQLQTAFVLTEVSQPKLPEKKKKLGGLRGFAVKGTLFFTGAGLVVGACTPAQRAILEGAFPCDPGPIAAADGDTAVIENPNQITISGNIFDDKNGARICLPTGQTVSVELPPLTPEPDSYKTVIGGEVDNKAEIPDVASMIDNLYKNPEYKKSLKNLVPWPGSNVKLKKSDLKSELTRCRNEKERSSKSIICRGIILDYVGFAQQFPLESSNPVDAEINTIFMNSSRALRSALINEGFKPQDIDKSLQSAADQLPYIK